MHDYWENRDPQSEDDRNYLARQCYELRLASKDDHQIAAELGISPAEVNAWTRLGKENAPVEETDRELEIARVNAWNARLETIWEELSLLPLEQREEYIHRFVASFDKLSKGRRALGGLDRPSKVITTTQAGPMESVDDAIQRLAIELGLQDQERGE